MVRTLLEEIWGESHPAVPRGIVTGVSKTYHLFVLRNCYVHMRLGDEIFSFPAKVANFVPHPLNFEKGIGNGRLSLVYLQCDESKSSCRKPLPLS